MMKIGEEKKKATGYKEINRRTNLKGHMLTRRKRHSNPRNASSQYEFQMKMIDSGFLLNNLVSMHEQLQYILQIGCTIHLVKLHSPTPQFLKCPQLIHTVNTKKGE